MDRNKMRKMADIDEIMYSCGLEILHPGGIEKTDEMARICELGKGNKVLDIGSGKGVTAFYLAQKYECEVIGVDLSERMIEYAKKIAKKSGLNDMVSFRRADAHNLPFENESFDIVLAECTTVLLDKGKAFSEFLRVTRSGGYIGDLEMTWQRPPPKELIDKVYYIWDGFRTMTLKDWKEFYERIGMDDVKTVDFSETIPDMKKIMKKELGLKGMIKMGCKLLLRPDLGKAMNEYTKIFKEYSDYIWYGYIVGRKK
ncbi:MAG: class I SAM-dependent methyltransferase [Candidatus Bathyarchaeia archaeon]